MATTAVGLLFKISAVPFHMWAPDAYEGAPTTVTAYLSVASKAASIAFLLRIFLGPLAAVARSLGAAAGVVAVATLTLGNLAAINQTNIKRLLAYSSISHAGYMLLGLIAGNDTGINGIAVYVMVYTFMNLGAFLVIVALRRKNIIGEDLDDIAGLMHKSPGYAVLMLIFLLSLAGIPPTAGFLGKYYIFLSLIETRHYTLAVIAHAVRGGGDLLLLQDRAQHVHARGDREGAAGVELRACAWRWRVSGLLTLAHRHLSRAVPAAGADFAVAIDGHYGRRSSHIRCSCRSLVTLVIIALFPLVAGYIVLVERKVLADFQVRLGPMRVGPHGLLQPIADALKLMLKEDIIPTDSDKAIFWFAPVISTFTGADRLRRAAVQPDTSTWRT